MHSSDGFIPTSFPRSSGPIVRSAICFDLRLSLLTLFPVAEKTGGGHVEVAGGVWLSRPHCWHGKRESASAFVSFALPMDNVKVELLQPLSQRATVPPVL